MCCFFFKQKTAYEMRISDWSSDVCSSDLEFADRFMKSIGEPGCDLQALVDELIELHAVERDEFNRVRLISMHIALTNIAAEGLAKAQAPGSQIIGFLADNLSTYHLMLRLASLFDGQIDKARSEEHP